MVFFSYVFDNVDGEVARLKGLCSSKGAFIDGVLDRAKEGVIFLAMALALYKQSGNYLALVFGFIAAFSVFMTNIALEMSGKVDKGALRKTHGDLGIIKWLKGIGIKQSFFTLGVDFQMFIISIGAVLNRLIWVFLFFMFVQNLYWMMIVFFVYRRK